MEKKSKWLSFIAALLALSPLNNAHASFDYTTGYIITLGGYFAQPQLTGNQQWIGNFPVNSTLNSQINDGYRFGFLTSILYQFTGTPYNALIGYNHLDTDDNTQTSMTTLDRINSTSTLDEIDLNVGRNFDLIPNLFFRLAGGARYTHLRFTSSFQSTTNATGVINTNGSANANTSGVGPIIFADGHYLVAYGFGIAARGYAGELFSNVNLSQTDTVQTSTAFNYVAKNQSQWLPNLGGNAGIEYTYITPNYNLNAEIGYMIDYYGNAILLNNTPQNTTGIYFQGPYLNLRVKF